VECEDCHTTNQTQLAVTMGTTETDMSCLKCGKDLGYIRHRFPSTSQIIVKLRCSNCHFNDPKEISPEIEGSSALAGLEIAHRCKICQSTLFTTLACHPELDYTCTFCFKKCGSRPAWEQHETTKHNKPRDAWICCSGNSTAVIDGGQRLCIFCRCCDPTAEHLFQAHNYELCAERQVSERTYSRMEKLTQHLRGFHKCAAVQPEMLSEWKKVTEQTKMEWTCGICDTSFNRWSDRLKHVGNHWDDGLDISHWNTFGYERSAQARLGRQQHFPDRDVSGYFPNPWRDQAAVEVSEETLTQFTESPNKVQEKHIDVEILEVGPASKARGKSSGLLKTFFCVLPSYR